MRGFLFVGVVVDLGMVKITIQLIFFIGLIYGQNHFNGKWYKVGTNWQVYIKIFESSEGQFLEQYMKIGKNQNLLFTKKIINPWIGDSYTKTDYVSKKYNTKYDYLKLIDDKTILYGQEKYQQYVLPRDFLKGN